MQVQPNSLVGLCLDVVVDSLDSDRSLVPVVQRHAPANLQPRMVTRATKSPELLVHLIEAGFACQCIDLSNCEKTEYVLKMLAMRKEQPHAVTLCGELVSKENTLWFARNCRSLRTLKIHCCNWEGGYFLNELSKARPELEELLLLGANPRVSLRKEAATRWDQLKLLILFPFGSIEFDAVKMLFSHGRLEEITCNQISGCTPTELPVCRSLRLLHVSFAHLTTAAWLRLLFDHPNIESVQLDAGLRHISPSEIDQQLEALGTKISPVQALHLSIESWGPRKIAQVVARCPRLKRLVLDCSHCSADEIASRLLRSRRKWQLQHLTLRNVEMDDALVRAIAKQCPKLQRLDCPCHRGSHYTPAWISLKRKLNLFHELTRPGVDGQWFLTLSHNPIVESEEDFQNPATTSSRRFF